MLTGARARLRAVLPAVVLTLPLAAIAGAGLQTARATIRKYERLQAPAPDLARQTDALMAELEDDLPAYGRVGYLDPQYFAFQPRASAQFYRTQYALAPRVLMLQDTSLDYVIYFSHEEVPLTASGIPPGLRVVRYVRPHVALLTRTR